MENTGKNSDDTGLSGWGGGWRIGNEPFPAQNPQTAFSHRIGHSGGAPVCVASSTNIKQSLIDNHKNHYSVSITSLLFIWPINIKSIMVYN